MTLRCSLQACKNVQLNAVGQLAVRWYSKLDWSCDPVNQECVVCRKPHTRLNSQPRSDGRHITCSGNGPSKCQGGLRLAADSILCRLCWDALLSDVSKLPRSLPVTLKSCDDWHYEWNTSWRTGRLQLETKSTLEFTDWRTVTALNWSRPVIVDLLTGLAWCGSTQHVGMELHNTMAAKLKSLHHRFSFWARRRTQVVCSKCSAVYVVGIRSRQGKKTNVLHVTRRHDLSDPRAKTVTPSSADKRPAKKSPRKKGAVNRPIVSPASDSGDRPSGDWYGFWTCQYPAYIFTLQSMRML